MQDYSELVDRLKRTTASNDDAIRAACAIEELVDELELWRWMSSVGYTVGESQNVKATWFVAGADLEPVGLGRTQLDAIRDAKERLAPA